MNAAGLNAFVQVPCLLGTVGLWKQARKHRIAPALGFLSEATWVVWSVFASAWGIIPWSLLWAVLYARTWWAWRR